MTTNAEMSSPDCIVETRLFRKSSGDKGNRIYVLAGWT